MLLSVNAVAAHIGFQSALCTTWNVTHEDVNSRVAEGTATEQDGDIDLHCYAPTYSPTPTSFPEQLIGTCWRSLNKKVYLKWSKRDQPCIPLMDWSSHVKHGLQLLFVGANIAHKELYDLWKCAPNKQNYFAIRKLVIVKSNRKSRRQEFDLVRKISNRRLKHCFYPQPLKRKTGLKFQIKRHVYKLKWNGINMGMCETHDLPMKTDKLLGTDLPRTSFSMMIQSLK